MSRNRKHLQSSALLIVSIVCAVVLTIAKPAAAQTPLGTAFTCQGQLQQGGAPVDETCDFEFRLWDDPLEADPQSQIGETQATTWDVSSGGFTGSLDFGMNVFTGGARWLQIAVCCPSPCADFTTLAPRQELTPAPHALALPGLYTQQNDTSPNLIGGHSGNFVESGALGATVSGGGVSGSENRVLDNGGSIGGGTNNQAGSDDGATNSANNATVGGGQGNVASGARATVPGGRSNTAAGADSFAAGRRAKANHDGAFVWADSLDEDLASTAANQFLIRAAGGVGIGTSAPAHKLHVASAGERAIFGHNTATSGSATGVSGRSDSPSGIGVFGNSTAETGNAAGVYGLSASAGYSAGVYGEATATSGSNFGVMGRSGSTEGFGVYGEATAETGSPTGVYGQISSGEGGAGVFGRALSVTGGNAGVYGQSDSVDGIGVSAWASSPTGATRGVYGRSSSVAGKGVHGLADATSGENYGVHGRSDSSSGQGVFGEATASSGITAGVHGKSESTGGLGVVGEATATSGVTFGVLGVNSSIEGFGVFGEATAETGSPTGVYGQSSSSEGGAGVHGRTLSLTGGNAGVYGQSDSVDGSGVSAWASSPTGATRGVSGRSSSVTGKGVHGLADDISGTNYGVFGQTMSPSGYGVYFSGGLAGTGTKSFIHPHPSDPSKQIHFVCLEGNESGTYFRGSGQLINGSAVIEVPEEFRLVSESEGLTVQLTAKGPDAGLWVESESLDQIVVRGNGNVEFDYFVNGVRRGFADLELMRENHSYVPQVRGVPFGAQYHEGHRQILVENGILNPDFTPNEQTAAIMGWTLKDAEPDEALGLGAAQRADVPGSSN